MASIKDLFRASNSSKSLVSKSLNDLDAGVESADFANASIELQNRVEPHVDYSKLNEFVFYGSAEQYYRDSFKYIENEYPYDGSGKEKIDWHLKGTTFDNYIFDKVYPRTNGYVMIGKNSTWLSEESDGYYSPSRSEYIYFEGGPHVAPQVKEGSSVKKYFPSRKNGEPSSNYYNEDINQQSNLEIDGDRGISLEFWINKEEFITASESPRQVICDLWNSGTWGTDGYGRFRVEISGSTGDSSMLPNFHVELLSGTAGFSSDNISTSSPTVSLTALSLTGSWNHFSLTFQNAENQMEGLLYQNGELVDKTTNGTSIGLITGSMIGQIGSLITNVSGTKAQRSWGLLSASLDEFRFWKTKRNAQEIGLNWFTQIDGGTNSDFEYKNKSSKKYSKSNLVDLGVYYKFNEGITGLGTIDSKILDYSGRITNGKWYAYGVEPNQRSNNSAIVEAGAASNEFKDPILYSYQPDVSAKLTELTEQGFTFDINNNASIYQSIPGWIRDEDIVNNGNTLLKLTQIISSYFDQLQLQVNNLPNLKNTNYASSSQKPYPFANRLVESTGLTVHEIFKEATQFEELSSRDDYRLFSKKLSDTKNRIYQNIYNNIANIFKSKGTEKSFRNLIRCYGIGDELVRLNLYGDEVTFELRENYNSTITRKKYANFFNTSSFNATVYQSASSTDIGSRSYITGSAIGAFGNTFQTEIFFPKFQTEANLAKNFKVPFTVSSLFGLHTVKQNDNPEDLEWATPDVANFQVQAVKTEAFGKDAYFVLTGTAGSVFPELTSSVFKDVYDNKSWNIAVRTKPATLPWAAEVSGTTLKEYNVEFVGYNTILDSIQDSFTLTGTISYANGLNFLTSSKRAFIGAHRTNFTSSVLQQSDARISSARFWRDYLDDRTILAHAKDPSNYGRFHPGQNAYINGSPAITDFGNAMPIPKIETLALQWNFDQVTGSDAQGEFVVKDYSSGSVLNSDSYGWFGDQVMVRHPGKGYDFAPNYQDAANREYVYTAKQLPPEVINSSDMIEIKREGDLEIFTRESRPIRYFFAAEKSMNAIISDEMIKLFATIIDFNNLIGEPVNRYRQDYKSLGKMRELFFRKVQNSAIDFEKFFDYYKWIDDSITLMLAQIFPISANFSEKIFTTIESHVLERNKYWTKFPTLEFKKKDPESGLFGISEMLYPYKYGSAPIPNSATGSSCTWWLERADRVKNIHITSSNSTVNTQRNDIKNAKDFRPDLTPPTLTDIAPATATQYEGSTFALRNFTKIYRFKADDMLSVHGGTNFPNSKKLDYVKSSIRLEDQQEQIEVDSSDIEAEKNCNDVLYPNEKNKFRYKLENSIDPNRVGYISGKGDIFAPFTLFSSSVTTGYVTGLTNFKRKLEINNYHNDAYGDDPEVPIQGPFTERHVGGLQYRHVNINTASNDTTLTRPEAWDLDADSTTLVISARDKHRPRATLYRDEYAKRPLNIKNIKWGTGSQAAGNYRKDYEVVQTSGRKLNNRFFVKNSGFMPETAVSLYIANRVDYVLPDFDKFDSNRSVFVERFSAPGGPEVNSRGSMDIFGEEYAIYNGLNYRNLIVREPLNEFLTEHCGQFGIRNNATPSLLNYNRQACYHKINRNPIKVGAYVNDTSNAVTTSINYDNGFVQHAIPRSDLQYKWINDSYDRRYDDADYDSTKMQPFGHVGSPDGGRRNFTIPSGSTSIAAPTVQFVTASEIYESSRDAAGDERKFGGVDFAGLNTWVYVPLTSSVNILSSSDGVYSNTAMFLADLNQADLTGALLVNALNLHRNGPYDYPSWKQIRTGESPIARYQKNNNIITIGPERTPINKENLLREIELDRLPMGARTRRAADTSVIRTFTEPVVTFKYRPLDTTYRTGYNFLVGDGTTRYENTIRHTFCNNLYYFANESQFICNGFNLPAWSYPSPQLGTNQRRPLQMHDAIYNQYNQPNTNSRFVELEYKEIIFPKNVNTGLNKVRSRVNYEEKATTIERDVGFGVQEFATVSDGSNGIDRISLKRRTFWNNTW